MTDKELLELAAKSANISRQWDGSLVDIAIPERVWNPLIDDGDALRLAIDLNMTINVESNGYTLVNVGTCTYADEYNVKDKYAATRRAIVRAAAAIGAEL